MTDVTYEHLDRFYKIWTHLGQEINEIITLCKLGKVGKEDTITRLHPYTAAVNIVKTMAQNMVKEAGK